MDEGRGAGRAWVQALLRAQCQAPLSSPWWRPGHVPPLRPSCFPGHTAGGSDLPPWGPPEPEARALSRAKPISTVTVRNTEEKVHGGGRATGAGGAGSARREGAQHPHSCWGREGQGAHAPRRRSECSIARAERAPSRSQRPRGPCTHASARRAGSLSLPSATPPCAHGPQDLWPAEPLPGPVAAALACLRVAVATGGPSRRAARLRPRPTATVTGAVQGPGRAGAASCPLSAVPWLGSLGHTVFSHIWSGSRLPSLPRTCPGSAC